MGTHLGILGGGQLGRMLALAARPLGIDVTVVDPDPEAPARAVARHVCCPYDAPETLAALSACDHVTFEFENIPDSVAKTLQETGRLTPPVAALQTAQDRYLEKSVFNLLGIRTTRFAPVHSKSDLQAAFSDLGPLVLKTRRFGYDGKGQAVIRTEEELDKGYESLKGAPAIAEELVVFDRELSVLVCRSKSGEHAFYPLTQNIHEGGILRKSLAPAPQISSALQEKAEEAARKLTDHFGYVGVLALELFVVGEDVIANEFAPRVHNSGHWTIEGATTSQFENHVRAVCGLPLGRATLRAPAVMLNLIGSLGNRDGFLSVVDCHYHGYEKEERPGRKVGQVTFLGSTPAEAETRAEHAALAFLLS